MQKKEYIAPELQELGNLMDFTKSGSAIGSWDGAYPSDTNGYEINDGIVSPS